jgi:hypothetical protein
VARVFVFYCQGAKGRYVCSRWELEIWSISMLRKQRMMACVLLLHCYGDLGRRYKHTFECIVKVTNVVHKKKMRWMLKVR